MSKRSRKRNLPTLHRHLVDARGKSIKQKKKKMAGGPASLLHSRKKRSRRKELKGSLVTAVHGRLFHGAGHSGCTHTSRPDPGPVDQSENQRHQHDDTKSDVPG